MFSKYRLKETLFLAEVVPRLEHGLNENIHPNCFVFAVVSDSKIIKQASDCLGFQGP